MSLRLSTSSYAELPIYYGTDSRLRFTTLRSLDSVSMALVQLHSFWSYLEEATLSFVADFMTTIVSK